jgi:hypothetical protein
MFELNVHSTSRATTITITKNDDGDAVIFIIPDHVVVGDLVPVQVLSFWIPTLLI